jgi:hypothetical protein
MDENIKQPEKIKMNKTWILVAVLVIITVVLLIVSLTAKNPFINHNEVEKTPKVMAETTLLFSDIVRVGTTSGTYEVDININSGENKVILAQLEMNYNPNQLNKVDIKSGNFINNPVVLQKSINTADGRIKYWVGVKPDQSGISGSGVIATLVFSKPGTGAAQITFLPKTSISAAGVNESVLKSMASGYIFNLPTPTRGTSPSASPNISPTPVIPQ